MQETLFFTDRISARKGRAVQQQHFERCDSCGGTIHQQGQQQDRKGRCSERPSYHPRGGESDAPPNPRILLLSSGLNLSGPVCGKKFTLLTTSRLSRFTTRYVFLLRS